MTVYIKNIIILLLCLLQSLCAAAADHPNVSIAIVDVQLILAQSLAVQGIRQSVLAINEDIQIEQRTKKAELKNMEESLLQMKESLSEEEFNKEVAEFDKKVSIIQKDFQDKKLRLEQGHSEAMQKVHARTIEIISQLSNKYHFNLVLPSSQILFALDNLHISQEVLDILNETLQTVKVNY